MMLITMMLNKTYLKMYIPVQILASCMELNEIQQNDYVYANVKQ